MEDARLPDDAPVAALPLSSRDGVAAIPATGGAPSHGALVGGPLVRTITTVALPAVASMLLMTIFSTADAYWVGRHIGPDGLAAVSTSLFWIWLLIACAELVSVGLTSVASRRHGERRHDAAADAVGNGVILSLLLGSAAAVLGHLALGWIFGPEIERVLAAISDVGSRVFVLAAIALVAYLAFKYIQRRRFLEQIRMDRITPDELRRKLQAGEDVVVVDLRGSADFEMEEGTLPGAFHVPPDAMEERLAQIPPAREVVLFCT